MGATAELARFSVEFPSEKIPKAARQGARRSLLDCLGVALAGLSADSTRIISNLVRRESAPGPSVVLGQGFRSTPSMAALANGTIIHALDYDDMGLEVGHPSAAVVPCALAVAEAVGASGEEFIDAMVIGFEVAGRLGASGGGSGGESGGPYAQGYHGTPIYGVFGATAAATRLLRLDVGALRNAFGIAASEASGVRANFGTMTKPYHAGEANRAGVVAAYLARDGFVANVDAIETRYGWGDAVAGSHYDPAKLTKDLGKSFILEQGASLKRFPCCGANHAAIRAIGALMSEEGLKPDDIAQIDVYQSRYSAQEILIYPWPKTGLEGKFSLAFNVAEAWRSGDVTVESFSDEQLAQLEPYRAKVVVHGVDGRPPVKVELHLVDGRLVANERPSASNSDPMSAAEIEEKFRANTQRAGRGDDADAMLAKISEIEELSSLEELTKLF